MTETSMNTTALWVIVMYYLLINIILYGAMVIDKRKAIKEKKRIPEKNLYLLAVLGGGFGGLVAMVTKHHKNRHLDFILVFTITAILHCIVALFLIGKLMLHV